MKKIILLLIFADIIFTFGAGLYGPIYAIFVEKIGGDILDAGIAWAIFLVVMATLEIPFGKLVDKYGKKIFLSLCYLISSIAIFGYMFTSNKIELFFLQFLIGVAFAMGDPAWDAWFSEIIPRKERGFDWALYHAFSGYGQGAAAIIGGILAQFINFQFLFFIGGSIAMISFFTTLCIYEEKIIERRIWHRHRAIKRRHHR